MCESECHASLRSLLGRGRLGWTGAAQGRDKARVTLKRLAEELKQLKARVTRERKTLNGASPQTIQLEIAMANLKDAHRAYLYLWYKKYYDSRPFVSLSETGPVPIDLSSALIAVNEARDAMNELRVQGSRPYVAPSKGA
jgi:hypothetical protein